MNIKTNRLIIREFKLEDWEEVYKYTSQKNSAWG